MYITLYVLCVCLTIAVCLPEEKLNTGLLTPGCSKHYNRLFVTRTLPPRTYQYFHEYLEDPQDDISVRFRIVGGRHVSIEQVPYMVLYGKFCGGSLISPEWVITAAHCKNQEKYVYAGATRRSAAIERFPHLICAHFLHPLWDPKSMNHDYDYQLILLEVPVPVTLQSRPIAIGSVSDVLPGTLVAVSGWGHLQQKDKMQEFPRRVYVPIMDHEDCRALPNREYRHVSPRMFCAGYPNGTKDSCQGDSGGPVVVNGHLLGLVSFGVGCAQPGQPGVYTIIPLAREWIRRVTGLPL